MAAVNINREEFLRLTAGDKPVLVDFWAPWCGYCRRIGPGFDRLAEQYADSLDAVKINIDEEEALAEREGIDLIPTLILYRNGQALASITAPDSKAVMEEFIRSNLAL